MKEKSKAAEISAQRVHDANDKKSVELADKICVAAELLLYNDDFELARRDFTNEVKTKAVAPSHASRIRLD